MISANNFKVENATSKDINSLNYALNYLQSDPNMARIVKRAADLNVVIVMNNDKGSFYRGCGDTDNCKGIPTIQWDSTRGIEVFDSSNRSMGIISSASALGHEMLHATDKNFSFNPRNTNVPSAYENAAENMLLIKKMNLIKTRES